MGPTPTQDQPQPARAADDVDPDLSPEPDWEELASAPWIRLGPSYVSGEPDSDRIRLRYYRRPADGALTGKAWYGPGTEGPPGHAHGGSMAALLDEAMGAAAWVAGHPSLAARIQVDFRKSLPLLSVVRIEAWIVSVEKRKVTLRGRLLGAEGQLYAESEGLFLKLKSGQFGEIVH